MDEIVTGNLIAPGAPGAPPGVAIDRGATLLAPALPLAAGSIGAYRLEGFRAGALTGLWSRLIGGLIAFLMLMGITYLFLPIFQHDPQTL